MTADAEARRIAWGSPASWFTKEHMHLVVAIAGLAFLILIHGKAGHFVTALAVNMRPRRFYIFFPPALVKWKRNRIEYGIGSIPLGGYVKIRGCTGPRRAISTPTSIRHATQNCTVAQAAAPVEQALAESRLDDAAAAMPALRQAVTSAELSDPARRAAERGLDDVEDALSRDAYWRAPTSKRIAVIAGPATNFVFAIVALAIVFMLGVPSEVSRSVEEVQPGSTGSGDGPRARRPDHRGRREAGGAREPGRSDPRQAAANPSRSRSCATAPRCSSRARRSSGKTPSAPSASPSGSSTRAHGRVEATGLRVRQGPGR